VRLGVLGGTFDPIHSGHVLLAQAVREQLPLDRVLFVPAADPPHKDDQGASAVHRLEMVRLAIDGLDGFELCHAEHDRTGPSYTVDTLRELRRRFTDSELYLIIGADNVAELSSWYDPEGILSLATIVSGTRVDSTDAPTSGFGARIQHLSTPVYEISSTEIRQRLSQGLPVRYLVPEAVERYAQQHNLYRGS
jgi:nicotinate-nucleotide adenylyltransferase|tara:strand:+ start:436 stop:1014 length:579 start_codon:yes stop_codon:yes gene_type:complete